ncbi:MAG: c-type cytochrome [Propylenella sp.]
MRITSLFSLLAGLTFPIAAFAQGEVSVERGLQVSITAGCHDCHTEGYMESNGQIDPAKAMKGSSIGWRGPWGTTYAKNLRVTALVFSEKRFVQRMKILKTRPSMPWYNVNAMDESDLQSLYQYIRSLGEVGEQAPMLVNPGEEPTTSYIQLVPPQMPKN